MTSVIVGKWGKHLAIRVPAAVVETVGLSNGEAVEIEVVNGDLMIRRTVAQAGARHRAEMAAAEIGAESDQYSLGDMGIRSLLEGRAARLTLVLDASMASTGCSAMNEPEQVGPTSLPIDCSLTG